MALYNQTIQLIELTKELERIPVDTLTSTYALGHTYKGAGNWIRGDEINNNGIKYVKFDINPNSTFYKNIVQGKIELVQINAYREIGDEINPNVTELTIKSNGNVVYSQQVPPAKEIAGKPTNGAIYGSLDIGNTAGTVEIEYYSEYVSLGKTYWAKLTYITQAIADIPNENKRSVTDVINRVLDVGVGCRTQNEKPFYKLDPVYAEMFSKIPAPEYTFTRATLYEVLLEIGTTNNLGAIPSIRLHYSQTICGCGAMYSTFESSIRLHYSQTFH